MRPLKGIVRFAACTLFQVLMFLLISGRAFPYDFPEWEHGFPGYQSALKWALDEEMPLILYFHTDWCKWSRKMNVDYLAAPEVEDYLRDVPKVEINPDRGNQEKELCKRSYRVTGYPTLLVLIPAFKSKPQRIWPFFKGGDWTVDQFMQALSEKIAYEYNSKGHYCLNKRSYGDARDYFEMALDFDSENAYSYYGLGAACYADGHGKKDIKLLEKAEENYLKALAIDSKDGRVRKALEGVRRLMEHLK